MAKRGMDLMFEAFGENNAGAAERLYRCDATARLDILRGLAEKSGPEPDALIPCDGGGVGEALCILCLKFPGASEETEPLVAAGMISRVSRHADPLPKISEDRGVLFCAKTLVSLALFLPALLARWNRRGAPSPDFYRRASVSALKMGPTAGHRALSAHHRGWEDFLHEQFCPNH